jgi:hypothetical protein
MLSGGAAHWLHCGTGPGSSAHSNSASSSLLEKTNVAGVSSGISAGGPDSIAVSGAVSSSIVHCHSAAIGSASRCCVSPCTAKVCWPATEPLPAATCASV